MLETVELCKVSANGMLTNGAFQVNNCYFIDHKHCRVWFVKWCVNTVVWHLQQRKHWKISVFQISLILAATQGGSRFVPCDTILVPYIPCPCVYLCPSQVRVLSKQQNELSWFGHGIFLQPIVHFPLRKFGYLWKTRVLPSGTLLQTLDLENFTALSRSCCWQNLSTVELVDHTYKQWWVVAEHHYFDVQLVPTVEQLLTKNLDCHGTLHNRCALADLVVDIGQ